MCALCSFFKFLFLVVLGFELRALLGGRLPLEPQSLSLLFLTDFEGFQNSWECRVEFRFAPHLVFHMVDTHGTIHMS
jgi:hypothetical protein